MSASECLFCGHIMDLCENVSERLSPGPYLVKTRGAQSALPAGCRSSGPALPLSISSLVLLAGLEGHLQHPVSQAVPIKASDGHGSFVIVGHGDEAEALTFVGGKVADHLDVGYGAKWSEELPQDTFVSLRGQVVDKNAPSRSGGPREVDSRQAGHAVDGDG